MSRQENGHASTVEPTEKQRRRRPAWRQEARPGAARRPVQRPSWAGGPSTGRLRMPTQRPSWAPGGPCRSRLGRQEARPEAVLGVSRPVQRRQEARLEAVLGVRGPVQRPSGPPGGQKRRFCRQRNRRFCGHVAMRSPARQVPKARHGAKPHWITFE